MVKFFLGAAAKKYLPFVLIGLVSVLSVTHYMAYSKGKANQKYIEELTEAKNIITALENDIKILIASRERTPKIVERIKNIYVEVPTPNCDDLGNDWVFVANEIFSTGSGSVDARLPGQAGD